MQYLAIVTPDGLLACVRGPYEGKMGDWGMYKDDMDEILRQKAFDLDGERVYVFGDKGFFLEECVIGAFRAAAGSELSEEEEIFNAYMAKERMAVEWGFEKVASLFSFNRLPVSFKYGLSPIATYYITSVLLTNCHTCYNGSKASVAFKCNPPTVRCYLGFEGSPKEERELDMYLDSLS
jgi:hypothetical protein